MKIYVDDIRDAPYSWYCVKDCETAKRFLMLGECEEISIDHDLGACKECMNRGEPYFSSRNCCKTNCQCHQTGYDLLKWMHYNKIYPKIVHVHSANPIGSQNMCDALRIYMPYDHVIERTFRRK